MSRSFSRVLITGTTSGLGKAFKEYYQAQQTEVLSVNRREIADPFSTVLDISDPNQVASYLRGLKESQKLPDLFLLNAGINRADNIDGLDLEEFSEVMRVNMMGVLTFVSALQQLKIQGRTIAVLSSTSNIVPNPAHLGYYASKCAIHELFKLLDKKDLSNHYKSVILSPVHTHIMDGYPKPSGLQGKIFNFFAVTPEEAVPVLSRFFQNEKSVLWYTRSACLFYFAVRAILKLYPRLYQGTKATASPVPLGLKGLETS